ncbi:MAG: hypothetical protein ACK42Z_06930 [Candidatus Kapaibacteriota bacterium]
MKALIFFLCSAFILLSCEKAATDVDTPIRPLTEDEQFIISSCNDFAFRLFKKKLTNPTVMVMSLYPH